MNNVYWFKSYPTKITAEYGLYFTAIFDLECTIYRKPNGKYGIKVVDYFG